MRGNLSEDTEPQKTRVIELVSYHWEKTKFVPHGWYCEERNTFITDEQRGALSPEIRRIAESYSLTSRKVRHNSTRNQLMFCPK